MYNCLKGKHLVQRPIALIRLYQCFMSYKTTSNGNHMPQIVFCYLETLNVVLATKYLCIDCCIKETKFKRLYFYFAKSDFFSKYVVENYIAQQ